jgi:cephalosporin-C deacetylase-like acetyl esterase
MLYGNAVQNYYVDEVRKIYAARKARLAKIKTKKDAEKYVQDVRAKILKAFDLPSEKCPLDPLVTGEHKMPGMTIRNVVYYSRPEYPVTGLLFVPDKATKAPGVLFLCGHSQNGKASGDYQTCAITLAKQGFVVLMIDPVNQGERYQFSEALKKKYSIHCCNAHNFQGKQLHLCGEYFGAWRAWDAVRGIDYLQTLPEVDPDRIGVTGNSGGGTMTTFVNALEDRLIMAAASCYITTWQHEVENELPADIEQMPPDMLKYGLDMADFVIARAPRPTLILGQKNDFFDPRGTVEAYEDAKAIYSLLGAEDNVKVFIGPNSHGYHAANREQMY